MSSHRRISHWHVGLDVNAPVTLYKPSGAPAGGPTSASDILRWIMALQTMVERPETFDKVWSAQQHAHDAEIAEWIRVHYAKIPDLPMTAFVAWTIELLLARHEELQAKARSTPQDASP